ncbi:hypothetical protein S7335_5470 [Synechococcus sp. PCC 7335]|nr:hypothetical protein S7335_5470 [Synechococcus sp. PCC 7335]
MDETYCKIKEVWKYRYHAVNSVSNTLDPYSVLSGMPKLLNAF